MKPPGYITPNKCLVRYLNLAFETAAEGLLPKMNMESNGVRVHVDLQDAKFGQEGNYFLRLQLNEGQKVKMKRILSLVSNRKRLLIR